MRGSPAIPTRYYYRGGAVSIPQSIVFHVERRQMPFSKIPSGPSRPNSILQKPIAIRAYCPQCRPQFPCTSHSPPTPAGETSPEKFLQDSPAFRSKFLTTNKSSPNSTLCDIASAILGTNIFSGLNSTILRRISH